MNWKFCPNCGKGLVKRSFKSFECVDCRRLFFDNPRPCVSLIMEDGYDHIVLTKRKVDPGKGWWGLPGGFIDCKETVEQALKREVREELDVKIEFWDYLGSYQDKYRFGGVVVDTVTMVYATVINGVKPKAGDDVAEVALVPINRIPIKEIYFKSLQKALKDYLKKRQTVLNKLLF